MGRMGLQGLRSGLTLNESLDFPPEGKLLEN